MDYDALPEASTSTASYAPSTKLRAAPQQVTLPANTPFDLDAYASQYTGMLSSHLYQLVQSSEIRAQVAARSYAAYSSLALPLSLPLMLTLSPSANFKSRPSTLNSTRRSRPSSTRDQNPLDAATLSTTYGPSVRVDMSPIRLTSSMSSSRITSPTSSRRASGCVPSSLCLPRATFRQCTDGPA